MSKALDFFREREERFAREKKAAERKLDEARKIYMPFLNKIREWLSDCEEYLQIVPGFDPSLVDPLEEPRIVREDILELRIRKDSGEETIINIIPTQNGKILVAWEDPPGSSQHFEISYRDKGVWLMKDMHVENEGNFVRYVLSALVREND